MKTTLQSFLILFFLLTGTTNFAHEKAVWKEMKEFHTVMSKTFHASEENNLQPLKEMSGELTARAKAWKESAVPAGWDAKKVSPILSKLEDKCKAVEAAVKAKKSDEELKKMIAEAHDVFHEIVEKCMPHEEGHQH
jgi:hypothetical protein